MLRDGYIQNVLKYWYPVLHKLGDNLLISEAKFWKKPQWYHDTPKIPSKKGRSNIRNCPSFIQLMAFGHIIPAPCDIELIIKRKGKHKNVIDIELGFHNTAIVRGLTVHTLNETEHFLGKEHADAVVIKISTAIGVTNALDRRVMYVPPFFRKDSRFELIPGIIDHNLQHQWHFFLKWYALDEGKHLIKAGTPMAQCFYAAPIDALEIEESTQEFETIFQGRRGQHKLYRTNDYARARKGVLESQAREEAKNVCPYKGE